MHLWAETISFEHRFSRFNLDSEITKVNKAAGGKIKVSTEFIDLAQESANYQIITNGLYSPFVLPALQKAGYKGSWPNPDKFESSLNFANRKNIERVIELDAKNSMLAIPKDTAIDFGGIGKGYLLITLSKFLDSKQVKSYWLSLGGDIICKGYDIEDQPWQINVNNALGDGKEVTIISNSSGEHMAIATSGITKRKGRDWHHIINPRTQKSAKTDILTATVVCNNSVDADIFAKCIVILGSQEAKNFIKKFKLQTYIQTADSAKIHIDSLRK